MYFVDGKRESFRLIRTMAYKTNISVVVAYMVEFYLQESITFRFIVARLTTKIFNFFFARMVIQYVDHI